MTEEIAKTPEPPYFAVIFTSVLAHNNPDYQTMSGHMLELAHQQAGFLGVESARSETGLGITVSYWQDEVSIRAWKQQLDHQAAQKLGREKWYTTYQARITRVERAYGFEANDKITG